MLKMDYVKNWIITILIIYLKTIHSCLWKTVQRQYKISKSGIFQLVGITPYRLIEAIRAGCSLQRLFEQPVKSARACGSMKRLILQKPVESNPLL